MQTSHERQKRIVVIFEDSELITEMANRTDKGDVASLYYLAIKEISVTTNQSVKDVHSAFVNLLLDIKQTRSN